MNKQRILTIVAVVCLVQLAVLSARQLEDKNSDLQRLRIYVHTLASSAANLFADHSVSTSANKSQAPETELALAPVPTRPRELAPTFIRDETDAQTAAKSVPSWPTKASQEIAQKSAALRDPFIPFFSIRNNSRGAADHPLSNYSLKELRVTAIISDSTGNFSASIEAHDGKSFIVRVGTRVGENGGQIDKITSSTIFISEPQGSGIKGSGIKDSGTIDGPVTRELSLKTPQSSSAGVVTAGLAK